MSVICIQIARSRIQTFFVQRLYKITKPQNLKEGKFVSIHRTIWTCHRHLTEVPVYLFCPRAVWGVAANSLICQLAIYHSNMFCLYLIRGVQSSLKSQPILTQSRHIGNVIWPGSKINCMHASPVSAIRSPNSCVSLKNQGSLLPVKKMPFNSVSINKVFWIVVSCYFSQTCHCCL